MSKRQSTEDKPATKDNTARRDGSESDSGEENNDKASGPKDAIAPSRKIIPAKSTDDEVTTSSDEAESSTSVDTGSKSSSASKVPKDKLTTSRDADYFTVHLGTLDEVLISKANLDEFVKRAEFKIPHIPDRISQATFERDDREIEKKNKAKKEGKAKKGKSEDEESTTSAAPETEDEKEKDDVATKKPGTPKAPPSTDTLVFSRTAVFALNKLLHSALTVLDSEMRQNVKVINLQKQTRQPDDLENVIVSLYGHSESAPYIKDIRESAAKLEASYTTNPKPKREKAN